MDKEAKRLYDMARYRQNHPNANQHPKKGQPNHERHNATIRRKRRLGIYPTLAVKPQTKRTCPVCKTIFMGKGNKVYCSKECGHQAKCIMDSTRFYKFAKFARTKFPEVYESYVSQGNPTWNQRRSSQ